MTSIQKSTVLQSYNMALYRGAIHPEFFDIRDRVRVRHGEYQFEAWIFEGGHVARFELGDHCVSEVVIEEMSPLPERGLITALPCAGERDYESDLTEKVGFMTSIQTETLTDHLYLGTFEELLEHGEMCDGISTSWEDGAGRRYLSMLETQRYRDEIHLQAYHLHAEGGLVLRSQSIFQVRKQGEVRKSESETETVESA